MTDRDLCFRLDELMSGDLVGPPRDEFERHLEDCPRCRDEAESFSRIADLLRAADRELDDCPPLLPARIHDAVSRRRVRRWITSAAAVIVLAAIGGLAWMAGGRFDPAAPPEDPQSMIARQNHEPEPAVAPETPESVAVVETPRPAPAESAGLQAAAVTVEFSDDVIGVPIETDDPSVTILWVYPTLTQVAAGD